MRRTRTLSKPTTPTPNTDHDLDRRRRVAFGIAMVTMVLALLAASCGGNDGSDALEGVDATPDTPSTTVAPSAPGDDDRAGSGGSGEEVGDGGVAPTALPTDIGRDIIFTADLQIAVTDVAAAGVEATQKIEALGGFLFGQQTVGGTEPTSILVFKIIPEQFQTALEQLGAIGELRNQTVSADDVTERVVDLESQITTNEASVERLRALLEGAGSVKELAQLESELLKRETTLEQLRGALRTIRDQVAFATITVRIEEARLRPGIEVVASVYPGFEDSGTSCPGTQQQLTVDRDTMATVCWEIRNTGDTDLTAFQLTDTVLDVTLDDLLVIDGDPAQPLRPGQSIILAHGLEVDRRIRLQTRVSADPVTADGVILEDRTVASTTSVTLNAEDPGGIPSFGEGLSRSWDALIGFFEVLILAAGLALPFLWVPVLAFLGGRWLAKRRGARSETAPTAPSPQESDDAEMTDQEKSAETAD